MTMLAADPPATAPTALAGRLVEHLGRVLLGKEQQIRNFVAAVAGGGHVLLVDAPGVGKTTLARGLAAGLDLPFARIQGTVDLMPTDLTGVSVYEPGSGDWVFHPGPLLHNIVLLDELNRIAPRSQSALLEAMAEGQVTVDGVAHAITDPSVVVATTNPLGYVGTFPLVDGLVDRFAISMELGLPGRESERALLADGGATGTLEQALVGDAETLMALQHHTSRIFVAPPVLEYVLELVDEIRTLAWLSPRASQALIATARGCAAVAGRDHVIPDDVRQLAPAVLGHRVAGAEGDVAESTERVRLCIASVAPPRPGR